MKRIIFRYAPAGLIIFSLLLTVLCGCSNQNGSENILQESSAQEDGKTALTFFGFKADAKNLTAIEDALQSFMAEDKNVDISYEGIKGREYWDAFDKRDATGTLDDVFMIHHDHVVAMSTQGKLADLSNIKGIEKYTDEAKSQFVNEDGSVYFLPTSISTYNLYVNYDVLEAHGQKIPENWADFQEVCDYFVSRNIIPVIINNMDSLPTLILGRGLFEVYQSENVKSVIDDFNSMPSLLAQTLEPGVEQVADMIKRGWFDCEEALITEQTSDDLKLFLEGERPFMISGGWATVRVSAENPSFSYGVHPYPILDDGSVLSIQVDTCVSINANSPNVEYAKKFVEHLIEPDVIWNYCDSQASYTPLSGDTRMPSDKTLVTSIENLKNGRISFRFDYRINLPMETALYECTNALLTGSSVGQAQKILIHELQK